MIIASYEDRPAALSGLKLLLLSVSRVAPGIELDVTTTKALAPALERWASTAGLSGLAIRTVKGWPGSGWNVKPGKLLEVLGRGHSEVVWIDSDIVAHRDFRPMLADLSPDILVIGQEFRAKHPEGGRYRAAGWGLTYARSLPFTVNSGFIRVTPHHEPLLLRWQELLTSPAYQAAQSQPLPERPVAMLSDQDALWALLASVEFATVPVRYLACGREIIQNSGANGYHAIERLGNLGRGLPPLIHMLGREKPWDYPGVPSLRADARDYLELAAIELSPYVSVARRYKDDLGEPADWLDVRTGLGKLCALATLGHPTAQGLPLALLAWGLSRLRKPRA